MNEIHICVKVCVQRGGGSGRSLCSSHQASEHFRRREAVDEGGWGGWGAQTGRRAEENVQSYQELMVLPPWRRGEGPNEKLLGFVIG